MAVIGYFCLMLGFFSSIFFSGFLLYAIWKRKKIDWIEYVQWFIFISVCISFLVLLIAFYKRDFSLVYVAEYTDTYLPWYYALSAIWAGQEGSLLLWLFFITLMGIFVLRNKAYIHLSWENKSFFWMFFLALEGFFFLLLITVANPFVLNPVPLKQGNGLNPLLMHPGMVFHPPALFLGYAGFVVPAFLLLSCRITSYSSLSIFNLVRRWSIISWVFLSIGIILGMWWSYFELGWGGYWAWDPVENSPLLPWLCATSFLHVFIVTTKRKALEKTSAFFLGLTLIGCFIATFLTRSGIIVSLHAFGESTLGMPILFLILVSFVVLLYVTFFFPSTYDKEVSGIFSKDGILLISNWIFLGLCIIILIGTMYPVISEIFLGETKGVSSDFYNKLFLPIFSLLLFFLFVCPWIKWKKESIKPEGLFFLIAFGIICILLWLFKIKNILVLFGVSSGITGIFSILIFLLKNKLYFNLNEIGKWGIHLSICIMAISIAISSGYKKSAEFIIAKGQDIEFEGYKFKYRNFLVDKYEHKIVYRYLFDVFKGNKKIGCLVPEKIFYKIQNNLFSKVAVITRFLDEIYVSILQNTEEGILKIEIQKNPMVHWIWIGSFILSLCGIITYKGYK